VKPTTEKNGQRVDSARVARPWAARFARLRQAVRAAPRRLLNRFRRPAAVPRRSAAPKAKCPARTRVQAARANAMRVVARVRPLSRKRYFSQSRTLLARMKGAERMSAFKMLASSRVRRSPEAQHAVLAYLKLRTMKGGSQLPLSITAMRSMVGGKGWSGRRMGNFALVLRQASAIARRDKIGARQAFDKALKINGIYKSYYSGRCGA